MTDNNVYQQMQDRVANRLDPLTGLPMVTVGKIVRKGDRCVDATGREVVLDEHGRWVYA